MPHSYRELNMFIIHTDLHRTFDFLHNWWCYNLHSKSFVAHLIIRKFHLLTCCCHGNQRRFHFDSSCIERGHSGDLLVIEVNAFCFWSFETKIITLSLPVLQITRHSAASLSVMRPRICNCIVMPLLSVLNRH